MWKQQIATATTFTNTKFTTNTSITTNNTPFH